MLLLHSSRGQGQHELGIMNALVAERYFTNRPTITLFTIYSLSCLHHSSCVNTFQFMVRHQRHGQFLSIYTWVYIRATHRTIRFHCLEAYMEFIFPFWRDAEGKEISLMYIKRTDKGLLQRGLDDSFSLANQVQTMSGRIAISYFLFTFWSSLSSLYRLLKLSCLDCQGHVCD